MLGMKKFSLLKCHNVIINGLDYTLHNLTIVEKETNKRRKNEKAYQNKRWKTIGSRKKKWNKNKRHEATEHELNKIHIEHKATKNEEKQFKCCFWCFEMPS